MAAASSSSSAVATDDPALGVFVELPSCTSHALKHLPAVTVRFESSRPGTTSPSIVAKKEDPNLDDFVAVIKGGVLDVFIASLDVAKTPTRTLFKNKRTMLHLAAEHGAHTLISEIMNPARGPPNVNAVDDFGITALDIAAFRNDAPMIHTLIRDYHACIGSSHSVTRNTQMHIAAAVGNNEAIRALLYYTVDGLFETNAQRNTPLHFAALHGHTDTAQLLIEQGAPVAAYNKDGHAPVHVAAINGSAGVVSAIIDDAPLEATRLDKKGHSPALLAQLNGHVDLAKSLTAKFPSVAGLVSVTGARLK